MLRIAARDAVFTNADVTRYGEANLSSLSFSLSPPKEMIFYYEYIYIGMDVASRGNPLGRTVKIKELPRRRACLVLVARVVARVYVEYFVRVSYTP